MKNLSLFITVAVLLLNIHAAQAQREIIINEVREYMSQGDQTGFEIAILDAEPRDVENTWIRIMKKQKAKVTKSSVSSAVTPDPPKKLRFGKNWKIGP